VDAAPAEEIPEVVEEAPVVEEAAEDAVYGWIGDFTYVYYMDGETVHYDDIIERETATSRNTVDPPVHEGSTFGGWFTSAEETGEPKEFEPKETVVTDLFETVPEKIYVYAKFTVNTFDVTVDISGAADVEPTDPIKPTEDVPYGTVLTIPALKSTDKVFKGWTYTIGTADPVALEGSTYTVKDDVTFTAQWGDKAAITYVVDGGTWAADPITEVAYNGELAEPTGLTKEHYDLLKWTYTGTTDEVIFPIEGIKADLSLTANWKPKTNTVTFDKGIIREDVVLPETQIVNYNEEAKEPDNPPTAQHAQFLGWKLKGAAADAGYYDFKTKVVEPIILVADWEIATNTVTYDLNNQYVEFDPPLDLSHSIRYNFTVDEDDMRSATAGDIGGPLQKGDYDDTEKWCFVGWTTDAEGKNAYDTATAQVTQDITLYAQWEREAYKVNVVSYVRPTVDGDNKLIFTAADPLIDYTMVAKGDTYVLDNEMADQSKAAKEDPNKTVRHFEFVKWYYDADLTNPVVFADDAKTKEFVIDPAQLPDDVVFDDTNVYFYAEWKEYFYVTFTVNGERYEKEYNPYKVLESQGTVAQHYHVDDPEQSGQQFFDGWFIADADENPTNDAPYTADKKSK
jgi:uncharacterized repeat protein (TIGR02543 family)